MKYFVAVVASISGLAIVLSFFVIFSIQTNPSTNLAQVSGARTFYIDWDTGNDSNNGTTKSSPWKRQPYMKGFAGSYSHQAGDSFIFKGGVTWPNAAFQMKITQGGSSESNRDFYGADQSWYTGGSWTRPIFDFQHIQIGGGWNSSAGVFISGASYLTIDNLELIHHRAPLSKDGISDWGSATINMEGAVSYVTIQNSIIRDWSLPTPVADNTDGGGGGGIQAPGIAAGYGQGIKILHNVFTQSGVSVRSGTPLWLWAEVAYNEIYNTGTGMLGGGTIHDNYIHHIQDFDDKNAHQNGILTFVPSVIYNNVIHDMASRGNGIFLDTGWAGGTGVDLVYNNVIFNLHGAQGPIQIDTNGAASQNGSRIYNNTMQYPGLCVRVGYRNNGPLNLLDARNNLCISETNVDICYNNIGAGCANVNSVTNTNNVFLTPAQASAQGFSASNFYAPPSSNSPTVDKGTTISNFSYDIRNASRTGIWDVGAFEYGTSGALPPGSGTVSPPPVSLPTTYTLSVSKSGTGSGSVSGAGISCGSDCSEVVNSGTSLSLTPVADSGSTFSGWTGACTGTGFCSVTLNSNTSLTANFTANAPATVPLMSSLSFEAEAGLLESPLTSSGTTISQSSQTTDPTQGGRARYRFTISQAGTYTVKARVNAPSGANNSLFINIDSEPTTSNIWHMLVTSGTEERTASWGGSTEGSNPANVFTLSAGEHTLIIRGREANLQIDNFTIVPQVVAPVTYTVSVSKSSTGSGSVTATGISCGSDCSETVNAGTALSFTSTPLAGSSFSGWTGACSGTTLCSVTVNSNTSVGATFTLIPVVPVVPLMPSLSFEAEAGLIESPMLSAGGQIYQASQIIDPNTSGRMRARFNISSAGNYIVKMRVNAPSEANDSIYVSIDSEPTEPTSVWDISPLTVGIAERTVSWRGTGTYNNNQYNPKIFSSLSQGEHTLIVRGREGGVYVDNISIVPYVPAPTDTTAPTISLISSNTITSNSANITWSTNEMSNTQVDYGLTVSYGSNTTLVSTLSTTHAASIVNLSPSTLYHYRVRSRDAAGNIAISSDQVFTTSAAPVTVDRTAPVVSGISISNITSSEARLSWTTNELTLGKVDYGVSTGYGQNIPITTLTISPNVFFSGLNPSTTYHYRITSVDSAGNTYTSGDLTFTTIAAPVVNPPPTTSGGGGGGGGGGTSGGSTGGGTNSGGSTTGGGGTNPSAGGTVSTPSISSGTTPSTSSVVEVRTTTNLNIRTSPSLSGTIATKAPLNTTLVVTGSAVSANGYNWLPVKFANGTTGWAADTYLVKVTSSSVYSYAPPSTASPRYQTTSSVNVRNAPGLQGKILITAVPGSMVTVTGVAVQASGYTWFPVKFDNGLTGWAVSIYLTPVSSGTTVPVVIPVSTKTTIIFKAEDRIKTTTTVNVRSLPGTSNSIRGKTTTNALGTILSGPVSSGGYSWYQVKMDGGLSGWMVGEYLGK